MKKVLVYTGSRANYSSTRPIIRSLISHPGIVAQVVVGGPGMLEKYGNVPTLMAKDNIPVDATLTFQVEGETPLTMASSAGLGIIQASNILENLKPDIVLVVGDRYDVISIALAASFMNIVLAHTMGGEISGTIDESIRHAITKFANIHFPANIIAANRILQMGESPSNVHTVGCPRIDEIKLILDNNVLLNTLISSLNGVGCKPPMGCEKFILVSYHPVTTEFGRNRHAMDSILAALERIDLPAIVLWPNSDAGSNEVSKSIRTYRERYNPSWLFVCGNLPFESYVLLMKYCSCLVGNSSSGIRESCYIGTPVVNVGSRQQGRDRPGNVIDCSNDSKSIYQAIENQLGSTHDPFQTLYGDGNASNQIASILAEYQLSTTQKTFVCP
jgi:UDP-hydrolysing UDP-N-acetyl-D-glucosamine 2-epimerase